MSSDLIHSVRIPHDKVMPIGDHVQVRVPKPPTHAKAILLPEQFQDMAQHNIMAGEIVAMGPVAFFYKDADGIAHRANVEIGDWCVFRPFAGTFQNPDGKVGAWGGYRYLSAHKDVLCIVKAADMLAANPPA